MGKKRKKNRPKGEDKRYTNESLTSLNFDALTYEQLTALLWQIIENEQEKPEEEADFSLIDACGGLLQELEEEKTGENSETADSAEEEAARKESLQRIYAKAAILQASDKAPSGTAAKKALSKRAASPICKRVLRFAVSFAAVFLLLGSSFVIFAAVSELSDTSEWVHLQLGGILNLSPQKPDTDGNTAEKNKHDSKEWLADFSQFYAQSQCNGNIIIRYNPAGNGKGVRASTDVALGDSDTGTAYTKIIALNNQVKESYQSGTGTNGVLSSNRAIISDQLYAKKVEHKGTRTEQNACTSSWEVLCK